MKKTLITLLFSLVIFSCSSVKSDSNNLLLLKVLEDSKNEDSKKKTDKIDQSSDFWSKIDFAWKKAIAQQVNSIDDNNLPENLTTKQIQDALEMKKLEYNCLKEKFECYKKSDEKITDLTPIQYFTKLETLNLRGNSINTIPKEIEKLTKLKLLDLSDNEIEQLSTSINQLTNLEQSLFKGNPLSEETFSQSIFTNLNKLKYLDLLRYSRVNNNPRQVIILHFTPEEEKRVRDQVIRTARINLTNGWVLGSR